MKNRFVGQTGSDLKLEGGLRLAGHFDRVSEPGKPLVSIITVVRNGEKYLCQAIESVLSQDYPNIEYIIIDGGSTDSTLDIIREYDNKLAYWISEPDNGISDAFNKGIAKSTGDIIGIINSDDWYEPRAVQTVVNEFVSHPEIGIVCGTVAYWQGKRFMYTSSSRPGGLRRQMTVQHPTVFVRKEVYDRYGTFRNDFRYAMDYELMLRFNLAGVKMTALPDRIANMRLSGKSDSGWKPAYQEVYRAKIINGLPRSSSWLEYIYAILDRAVIVVLDSIGLKRIIPRLKHKFRNSA